MYGIMSEDKERVLCQRSGTNVYILKNWNRASMPAHRITYEEILDVHARLSKLIKIKIVIFEFTEEQVEKILVRKLQGY